MGGTTEPELVHVPESLSQDPSPAHVVTSSTHLSMDTVNSKRVESTATLFLKWDFNAINIFTEEVNEGFGCIYFVFARGAMETPTAEIRLSR